MGRVINEFDTFKLLMQENIDSADSQILFMLYQPLIGPNAIALYLTLVQEKQLTSRINLDFTHERLMLILDIDKIVLLQAFKQLEHYGLLVSYYYSSKSTYIYDLKKPLTANLFFSNEKLKSELMQKIGALQYERQKYYFLKAEPILTPEFIKITSNSETKQFPAIHSSLKSILDNFNHNKVNTSSPAFSNKLVKTATNNHHMRANLEKETYNTINHNKTLFSTTLNQMQIQKPEEYLFSLIKAPITDKLKTILQTLTEEYNLTNSVINCLFEYVWFKNNKRLEPNYILKIAKTFQDSEIDNVKDALKHLKLAFSKSKKNSYTNNYQQNVLWTKEDVKFDFEQTLSLEKTEKKPIKNGTMTPEEIKKILEEIDNY